MINQSLPALIQEIHQNLRDDGPKLADKLVLSHVRLNHKALRSSELRFLEVGSIVKPLVPKNSKYCFIQNGLQVYLLFSKIQLDDLDIGSFVKVQQMIERGGDQNVDNDDKNTEDLLN